MSWKAYAAVSGAGLLATYLFSVPPAVTPDRQASARADAIARRPQPASVDIQQEAARLQMRVREDADYREPSRNPFRFGARPVTRRPVVPSAVPEEPVATPPPSSPPPPPPIRLSGVATNTVAGARQRSAILVTPAGILTVREGDAVGAEYTVVRIEEDAVELAGADGSTRRITLRP
jgi:hypothetical protein